MEQECEKVLPMQSLNFSFYKQHVFFVFVWFGLVFVDVPPHLFLFPHLFEISGFWKGEAYGWAYDSKFKSIYPDLVKF